MYKKVISYMGKHVEFNALLHAFGGIGLGMLVMYYFKPDNPLALIGVFIGLSILGHLYVYYVIRK